MQETNTFLLTEICKSLHHRVHHRLDELGLYRGQQFMLFALWQEEGLTHSDLAEHMRVSPATVSNGVKRMEKAGFVERRPDPSDERVSRVYLTEAGRSVRGAVERTWRELDAQAFAGFDEGELSSLRQLLCRVLENLIQECVC